MANASIGGLVSGLDTASIISQLMQLEARPQTMLKSRVSLEQKAITSLQGLNTKLATLMTKADELSELNAWAMKTATSDNDKVVVSTTGSAEAASLTFTVNKLATVSREAYGVGKTATDTTAMPTGVRYQMQQPDGTVLAEFDTGDGSLRGIAASINATANFRATLIRVGGDDTAPLYDLHVTSKVTGAATAFDIRQHPADPNSPTPFLGGSPTGGEGQDAEVLIAGGGTVRSATNTIKGLMPGVDVTLLPGSKDASATITVAADPQAFTDKVKAMVDALNVALDDLSSLTGYNSATKTGGPMAGDGTLRDVRNKLLSTVTGGVEGASLAPYGIQTDRTGKLVFDEAKFKSAYTADPAKTAAMFAFTPDPADPTNKQAPAATIGFADALETLGKSLSNSIDGAVTLAIKSRTSTVDRMQYDIADWDVRLEVKRNALQRQYTALESALGKLQSQGNWLAGQLASLPQMNSGQ